MYTSSFSVTNTTTVKAIAYGSGYVNSAVAQSAYILQAAQGNYVTQYSYDLLGHLVQVGMTRPTGTQTRTFNYGGGVDLLSATNPENGTVSYTYDSNHRMTSRTDANGQTVNYTYDSLGRLTQDGTATYTYDQGQYGTGR